jgi:hypothetical protein
VVTPLASSGGAGAIQIGNTNGTWSITAGAGGLFLPPNDNTEAFGSPAKRLLSVFTPIIDTGTTGSGALKTNNGTTIFQWANTGTVGVGATPAATGKGVTFPASQSASSDANTLDDYAEGTWTPGVSFGGASVGVTYNTQTGRYTKMGRLVWVEFNVVLTSKGSSVGSAAVTGLPFAGGSDSPTGALIWTNMTTSYVSMQVGGVNAATTASVFGNTSASTAMTIITDTGFSNTSGLRATLVYAV